MEQEIHRIDIIPAVFVKYREDGNVVLRCLQGEETVDRAFEPHLFKNIPDLKYLLLGITTGVGYMQLTVCDGNEFVKYYHKKWNVLLK
jgi:hypothetical protein